MKKVFKNIIVLLILGTAIFIFRDSIIKSYFTLQDKYFPCTRQISYSIGSFDSSFGIKKEDFLNAIKKGEDTWETVVNKDLFVYQPDGSGELKINLVYDTRQENTQKLKSIDASIQNNQSSYNDLKSKVDNLEKEYRDKKAIFESKVITLKDHQGRYSPENIILLNNLQAELNTDISNINTLVNELNKSASSFNNKVKDYNTIGDQIGEEFEEGLYHSDKNGEYIDIYQFENTEKLTRVLMHELGHALGLDHVNNRDAIMYKLNTGTNLIPTNDDINALRTHCGLNNI